MDFLSEEIFNTKYINHLAWLDGIAQLWAGWQLDLSGYSIQGFEFKNYKLREAGLHLMKIDSSFFNGCDLTYARLNSSMIKDTAFNACQMQRMQNWCVSMENVTLNNCDLTGSDFKYSSLVNVSMCYSDLTGCSFAYADMDTADIRLANIMEADFTGTRYDYSKNLDVLPDLCYFTDMDGRTYMIQKNEAVTYPMPENFAYLPAEKLNKALHISPEQAQEMYNAFVAGWVNESVDIVRYKAEIKVYNAKNEMLYGFTTDECTESYADFEQRIHQICAAERKKNKNIIIDVRTLKKSGSGRKYEEIDCVQDYK